MPILTAIAGGWDSFQAITYKLSLRVLRTDTLPLLGLRSHSAEVRSRPPACFSVGPGRWPFEPCHVPIAVELTAHLGKDSHLYEAK